jgi:hypothetical protein
MPIFSSGYPEKTSNSDEDRFLISDSADSNKIKGTKWSTIKSSIEGFTDWITTSMLKNDSVNTSKILNGAVTADKIDDGAVTPVKTSGGLMVHRGYDSGNGTTLTTSYQTRRSVGATILGGDVLVRVGGFIVNANSGAIRTYNIRLDMDGGTIDTKTGLQVAFSSTSGNHDHLNFAYTFKHSPSAGAHTWNFQMAASANASLITAYEFMEVIEIMP